ncbi:uncharacterized protein PG998_008973 [Apiospora kogelbergensis]|uniref:uncharacterized protein n=1 Tax=Apiospora kogelbergensis TaxID=1337665 RepID=UPI00312DBE93
MALQQLSASLLTAKQETNVGLATINLDFSLVQVQPPKEFMGIRNEISPLRRASAEEGQPHVTARKLGALFQQWLPRTPNLIRAYGTRACEIAGTPKVNPKGSRADGLLAEHVGIDGTSVWAAATSGPDAIAIHLLACMLARIWSSAEATAIWAELVADRKSELAAVDETDPLCHLSRQLAKVTISRDQLKEWDSSAQNWIAAADEAMKVKQTQLRLIVNNVSLPVNNHPKLFQNVLQTWKSAMVAVDNLILGMPQSVENASVLLGICSWHLYPDMLALHQSPTPVAQHDPLVSPAGILTIGLQMQHANKNGVYWSLPLGHLRYYGPPVSTASNLGAREGRVSISELVQVAFGCVSRGWGFDRLHLASFIVRLWNLIRDRDREDNYGIVNWLGVFAEALGPSLLGDQLLKKQCDQLMRLGARQCSEFVCPSQNVTPVFGLTNVTTLLGLLAPEDGILYLRQLAQAFPGYAERIYVIRFVDEAGYIEYATTLKTLSPRDDSTQSESTHKRWLDRYTNDPRFQQVRDMGEDAYEINTEDILPITTGMKKSGDRRFYWLHPPDIWSRHTRNIPDENGASQKAVKFALIFGQSRDKAVTPGLTLWASETTHISSKPRIDGANILNALTDAVEHKRLSVHKTLSLLDQFIWQDGNKQLRASLRALATATNVYASIPDAKISLEITLNTLCDMKWVPVPDPRDAYKYSTDAHKLSLAQTFSCVAQFDSGVFSVRPDALNDVVAMASSGSIYLPAWLLSDPASYASPNSLRRVQGSIGKPGIAMLIPAKNPQVPKVDRSHWHVVNHDTFNGGKENSFQATTMHLLFTEYVMPIDTGVHGSRDFEIYFQESVITVRDRGKWVTDVDIIPHLRRGKKYEIAAKCTHDTHPKEQNDSDVESIIQNTRIVSVDDYAELLDAPEYVGVVRSQDNWIGRLATCLLSTQMRHPTVVLPGSFCWQCVQDTWLICRAKFPISTADNQEHKRQPRRGLKRHHGIISQSDSEDGHGTEEEVSEGEDDPSKRMDFRFDDSDREGSESSSNHSELRLNPTENYSGTHTTKLGWNSMVIGKSWLIWPV